MIKQDFPFSQNSLPELAGTTSIPVSSVDDTAPQLGIWQYVTSTELNSPRVAAQKITDGHRFALYPHPLRDVLGSGINDAATAGHQDQGIFILAILTAKQ